MQIMKKNSKKLLLWLYKRTKTESWVSLSAVSLVIPLSSTSLRALLKLHQQSGLLTIDTTQPEWYIQITPLGSELTSGLFPAVSDVYAAWDGRWTVLVFRQAPKTDKQFRYLRDQLVSIRAGAIARGVYLFPGDLPLSFVQLLRSLYNSGQVTVATVTEWQLGSLELLINDVFKLSDVAQLYSGISTEVQQLLAVGDTKKALNGADKEQLSSVFDRFYETTTQDIGLVSHYFSRVPTAIDLLHQMQLISTL